MAEKMRRNFRLQKLWNHRPWGSHRWWTNPCVRYQQSRRNRSSTFLFQGTKKKKQQQNRHHNHHHHPSPPPPPPQQQQQQKQYLKKCLIPFTMVGLQLLGTTTPLECVLQRRPRRHERRHRWHRIRWGQLESTLIQTSPICFKYL